MPKDYKRRAASGRKKGREPVAGGLWFMGGLLVGLFVSGLAWLKFAPLAGEEGAVVARAAQSAECEPVATTSDPDPEREPQQPGGTKPRFEFYTILPEMEVVVPDPQPEPRHAAVQPLVDDDGGGDSGQLTPEPVSREALPQAESYMLQMGSFRKFNDADRLKASLALVGIQAEIQRVNVNHGDIFHRVRSGPYSRDQVNTLRARLSENSINSLVIKLK